MRSAPVPGDLSELRRRIGQADDALAARFWRGEDVECLVAERARFIDAFLAEVWHAFFHGNSNVALLAVGGYGRGELHPHSDIDLMLLARNSFVLRGRRSQEAVAAFLRLLWDLKLDIGHSVRTLADCKREASRDVSVVTTMMERRRLTGSDILTRRLDKILSRPVLWPSGRFYRVKREEQEARHAQFDDVEYDLEPNIKGSPGGLRDIQTVGWIARRQFGTADLAELVERSVLTSQERDWLVEGRRFLWRVRFGLHLLTGRREDRLLFDHQRELARRFGYVDTDAQLGVEQFMHDYYRHVLHLREANDIVLQHFDESLTTRPLPRREVIEPVNERFRLRNRYIEVTRDDVFRKTPAALMEMFVLLANRKDALGVRAATIRLVREHIHLMDDAFRNDPEVTRHFIDLLKAPYTLVSQLTRMRRYGVLGHYIPEFGRIVGQMQHDLFHIYTVDAHTMMVIRNMRRFHAASREADYPLATRVTGNLPKIELLYIAGLFHDIGKGRGGNHSDIGAGEAAEFCRRHGLSDEDIELVAWLVREHLTMSTTAQRKDIHDPEVIDEFARLVLTETRLDYLYALTVADINATNPTLWNSWRATLMGQLYVETRRALRQGLDSPRRRSEHVAACRRTALDAAAERGLAEERVLALWDKPGDDFFLHHSPMEVLTITEAALAHDLAGGALVLILDLLGEDGGGASEVFVYAKDRDNLFADSVAAIAGLGLGIQAATVATNASGVCFNSYIVLKDRGPVPNEANLRDRIRTTVGRAALGRLTGSKAERRLSRRQKQFAAPTEVQLSTVPDASSSTLRVVAADRPGLLAHIGRLFIELELAVTRARITTLGERVEDVFEVTERDRTAVTERARADDICTRIRDHLDALSACRISPRQRRSATGGLP